VLGLVIASQSAGCGLSPVPAAANGPTPTPAPIGTVVTPVSVLQSITPIPPPTAVILVQIATATPGTSEASSTASVTPAPAQSPMAESPAATIAPSGAPQVPQSIASSGRITSVQLSSEHPVQLPCPDPRIVVGVPRVEPTDEVTLNCQSLDPAEIQPPPGQIVGGMVFRIFTDRAQEVTLPTASSIGVSVGDAASANNLVLGHLEGTSWVPVPGLQVDKASGYVSATTDKLGSYAVYVQS
jgi:hypothetical protein